MVQGGTAREVPPGETAPMVFWVPRLTRDSKNRLLALTFRPFSTGYFTRPQRGVLVRRAASPRVFQENRPKQARTETRPATGGVYLQTFATQDR